MTDSRDEERAALDAVREAASRMHLDAAARARIERRLAEGAMGGTTLREAPRRRVPVLAWSGVAAALIAAVVIAIPLIDRETTVSAAEILGRSQQALSAPAAGVEVLNYDLDVSGVLQQLVPREQSGFFTVEETVDHDHPGRYRLLKLGGDGQPVFGVASEPATRTIEQYIVADGQARLVRLTNAPESWVSLASVRPFLMRTLISLMQVNSSNALHESVRQGEPAYEISAGGVGAPLGPIALNDARIVVAQSDARVLDFETSGTVDGKPFSVTFHLRSRQSKAAAAISADDFRIEPSPGAVTSTCTFASSGPAMLGLGASCSAK